MSESEPIDKMSRARLEEYAAQLERDFQGAAQLAKHFKLKIDGAADGNYKQMYEGVRQELDDMKQFIIMQGGGHVRNQLLNLPDQIKEQQLLVTKRTAEIEEQRLELDKIKNGHKEFVLSAKEGDKPKFGNDKARDLAVAMLLQDDKAYNDLLDSTRNKERLQRLDEIELKHLEDLFKAYLTVAGMTGAR